MSDYLQGQTIHPYALFTDIAGDPVDPTVDVVLRAPDGTISQPTASSTVLGRWSFELPLDDVGVYRWEFHGLTSEGTAVCSGEACAQASLMVLS